MTSEINYAAILSGFDDLAAKGVIKYGPRETHRYQLGDNTAFTIEFHISTSLSKKPQDGDPISGHEHEDSDSSKPKQKPECFGPGSDIANDGPGLLITTVNNTHLLVINKFCMFRPQLLLLTSDSYRRQREPLNVDDFAAACTVLNSLNVDAPQFVIYNCGPTAGASRQHKHLQVLPRPRYLFPDNEIGGKAVPYRYFLRYLHDVDLDTAEGQAKLCGLYKSLLAEAEESLGENVQDNGTYIPHNVALVKEWIVVIPRRNIEVEGVTTNTAGMLGSVWLAKDEEMARWKQVGPKKVLAGLGVPA
ncbi:hypothetical protein BJX99DRAFT_193079 [Aspergillus californicus]